MEIKAMKPRLNNEGHIFLNKVKHPVLITQKGYDNVVAATLELGKRFNVLVITGSNTGGKTVYT
jgi:dsDNA-specific endonuclease/ATPase MutS2